MRRLIAAGTWDAAFSTPPVDSIAPARSGLLRARIDAPRRRFPGLRLGNVPWSLCNVYAPCRSARIEAGHAVVPGTPRMKEGPPVGSSAFLAVAETWARL